MTGSLARERGRRLDFERGDAAETRVETRKRIAQRTRQRVHRKRGFGDIRFRRAATLCLGRPARPDARLVSRDSNATVPVQLRGASGEATLKTEVVWMDEKFLGGMSREEVSGCDVLNRRRDRRAQPGDARRIFHARPRFDGK